MIVAALLLTSCISAVEEEEQVVTPKEDAVYMPTLADIQLISQSECEDNHTCYHVGVDYDGLLPREAEIRVKSHIEF